MASVAIAAVPLLKSAPATTELQFQDVPNAFRLRMHWYVFGPAWNVEEGARELQNMAAAHIGGVLLFPAYPIAVDDPATGVHNQAYLSPEYLSVLASLAETCTKSGLTFDTVLGTGWPYGGPTVSLDQSAHCIRMSKIRASADGVIEKSLREGERSLAVFVQSPDGWRLMTGADSVPDGTEILLFRSAPTRMQVKRAAFGAEGWVIDHYREESLHTFLNDVGSKLVDAIPKGRLRSIFSDSLEVYQASWTERMPEIFSSRRGYDLIPKLAALFDPNHAECRDLRCDFWRTLSEQAEDAYVRPLGQWCHAHGITSQVEAYGTPPVSIRSYRYVDIPVGEHYEWKEFSSSRWASSGGHLAAKPVILAEAWTWLGLPNRFADTLEQLKLCSDLHFLSGINALYGLTYAYSPVALGSPGWVPYFGPAINHTSPYWDYFSYLADYVSRASFVLQQGKPVADVALYLPMEDVMAEANMEQLLPNWAVRDRLSSNGPPPEFSLKNALHYESDVVKTIITNGYSFDGIDTFTLNTSFRIEQGRLLSGDGNYSILVLPNLTGIDAESMDRIVHFVQGGGTLIATKRVPDRAWGLREKSVSGARVAAAVEKLFGAGPQRDYRERSLGNGRVIFCPDEQGSLLKAFRTQPPDIRFAEPSPFVSFIHRRTEDRDFYFLANTSEQKVPLDCVFRVGPASPEVWDLKTGQVSPCVVFETSAEGTRLPVTLGPLESTVMAFRRTGRKPSVLRTNLPLNHDGARVFENGTYHYDQASGRRVIAVTGIPAALALDIRWRVTLGKDRHDLADLRSWTDLPVSRFFSGRGTYEGEFDCPPFAGFGVVLDLGTVRETADVRLNGKPAGVAWMRPYELDVSAVLRPGRNAIRVDVTNLLINKILGDGPIDYSAVYAKYGKRFPPGDEWEIVREPFPSGLLGPLRLKFYKLVTV